MGVTHELDLLMGETQEVQDMARSKMERGLIGFTSGAVEKIDKKVKESEEKGKKER